MLSVCPRAVAAAPRLAVTEAGTAELNMQDIEGKGTLSHSRLPITWLNFLYERGEKIRIAFADTPSQ